MRTTRKTAVLAAIIVILGTSACGAVADKAGETAGEKLAEKAIENQSGGNADVDISDGGVKITDGEGGTYEVDADGNISGSSGDGDYQIGAGADLPDGWPEALNPPAGAEIISAITSGDSMSVVAKIDGSIRDVYDALKGQLGDAGYEISSDSFTAADSGDFATMSATGADFEVMVNIASGSAGEAGTVATMSLQKVAG
jgi:hypothetical protein